MNVVLYLSPAEPVAPVAPIGPVAPVAPPPKVALASVSPMYTYTYILFGLGETTDCCQ